MPLVIYYATTVGFVDIGFYYFSLTQASFACYLNVAEMFSFFPMLIFTSSLLNCIFCLCCPALWVIRLWTIKLSYYYHHLINCVLVLIDFGLNLKNFSISFILILLLRDSLHFPLVPFFFLYSISFVPSSTSEDLHYYIFFYDVLLFAASKRICLFRLSLSLHFRHVILSAQNLATTICPPTHASCNIFKFLWYVMVQLLLPPIFVLLD